MFNPRNIIFILCNRKSKVFKKFKVSAEANGYRVRNFADNCFQDEHGKKLSITEVVIVAHGSRVSFGGNSEECIDGYTPQELVKELTQGPRKLPASVITLHLCGCGIGLIQPPQPSYIALFAEALAKTPNYKKVVVRGFQFNDIKCEYAQLLQVRKLDETKTRMIFNYYLLTKEQQAQRLQHQNKIKIKMSIPFGLVIV